MTKELSIFVDESGDVGETSRFYLITFVLHEQDDPITQEIARYEQVLADSYLPNIAMHLGPLLNGHDDYRMLSVETRKRLMSCFMMLIQHLPFQHFVIQHNKKNCNEQTSELFLRMKRDLTTILFDNLEYLQDFDTVKIYYDNGQSIVTDTLHDAIEYTLSKNAVIYKNASPQDYRLFQVADFICTLELTAMKYQTHTFGTTDERFFGKWGTFKKNYLKKIRKKRLN